MNSRAKPSLTDNNKIWRLQFVLDHVRLDGKFSEMYDTVHIDEKFFYIDKVNKSFILAPSEEIPIAYARTNDSYQLSCV